MLDRGVAATNDFGELDQQAQRAAVLSNECATQVARRLGFGLIKLHDLRVLSETLLARGDSPELASIATEAERLGETSREPSAVPEMTSLGERLERAVAELDSVRGEQDDDLRKSVEQLMSKLPDKDAAPWAARQGRLAAIITTALDAGCLAEADTLVPQLESLAIHRALDRFWEKNRNGIDSADDLREIAAIETARERFVKGVISDRADWEKAGQVLKSRVAKESAAEEELPEPPELGDAERRLNEKLNRLGLDAFDQAVADFEVSCKRGRRRDAQSMLNAFNRLLPLPPSRRLWIAPVIAVLILATGIAGAAQLTGTPEVPHDKTWFVSPSGDVSGLSLKNTDTGATEDLPWDMLGEDARNLQLPSGNYELRIEGRESIKFSVPADGTVAVLPGDLEEKLIEYFFRDRGDD